MPSDTYDPFLGLILQGAGNNNNTWGDKLNVSAIAMAARGIAGIVNRNLNGTTLDLSGTPPPSATRQDIDHIQVITGVLGGSIQNIIVPSIAKTWLFYNNTSGVVLVKTASVAEAMQVPVGTWKWLWCDGTQVRRLDYHEIGTIVVNFTGANTKGILQCNGASLARADFPNLYNKIGTNFGAVDGAHFSLPNMGTFTGQPLLSYWIKY